jgi:hypothetical protein
MRHRTFLVVLCLLAGAVPVTAQTPYGPVPPRPSEPPASEPPASTPAAAAPTLPPSPGPVEQAVLGATVDPPPPTPRERTLVDQLGLTFNGGGLLSGRLRIEGDFLLWWIKNGGLRTPLVTAGSTTNLGILGAPDTMVLDGNEGLDYERFAGGRLNIELWTDPGRLAGVQLRGFALEQRATQFRALSDEAGNVDASGALVLARPAINVFDGSEAALLVTFPGALAGGVNVGSASQLWGTELNVLTLVRRECHFDVHALVGVRYLDLDENLRVLQRGTELAGGFATFRGAPLLPGDILFLNDFLAARNQFYGGQVGVQASYRRPAFSGLGDITFDVTAKLAIGGTRQSIDTAGTTALFRFGGLVDVAPGGLLVLPTNAGHFQRTEWTLVPEVGATLGVPVGPYTTFTVGYSVLYWTSVARPGEQVSRVLNPTLAPATQDGTPAVGPAVPILPFRTTGFWAQGVSFGLVYRF